jgi:hypothetical protein
MHRVEAPWKRVQGLRRLRRGSNEVQRAGWDGKDMQRVEKDSTEMRRAVKDGTEMRRVEEDCCSAPSP